MLPELPYISRFAARKGGHGGNRRTSQIAADLAPLGVQVASLKDIAPADDADVSSPLLTSDQEFNSLYGFNGHVVSQLKIDATLSAHISSCDIRGAIVDDPVFFPKTMQQMAVRNIPVVSIIHNMECFVPRTMVVQPQWELLREEVAAAGLARLSVTIAREDAWLLRNFGMECYHHPYYPPADIEAEFAKVRIARRKSPGKFFLCLGTAYNPPTLFGMNTLIKIWKNLTNDKIPLVVAGYGVGRFFDEQNIPASVTVAGDASDEEMSGLLSECVACIIHQETGSGALTKIPELLRSGIPIIASQQAARSYGGTEGVYEYQDLSELPGLIRNVMQRQTPPPFQAKPDVSKLLKQVAAALRL